MKGLLIGLGIAAGAAVCYVVKKVNDDRQEYVAQSDDGVDLVTVETFKQAAKRKVNEILKWVAENSEKVESIVTTVSLTSTVLGVCVTALELYSSTKRVYKDPDQELLDEVIKIRERLEYLTPDVDVQTF